MRWTLSRTASSGRPTMMVLGRVACELSTSTATGTASRPTRAKVFSLASMGGIVAETPAGCKRKTDRRGNPPRQSAPLLQLLPHDRFRRDVVHDQALVRELARFPHEPDADHDHPGLDA